MISELKIFFLDIFHNLSQTIIISDNRNLREKLNKCHVTIGLAFPSFY